MRILSAYLLFLESVLQYQLEYRSEYCYGLQIMTLMYCLADVIAFSFVTNI
jgi:hypothetical protein